MRRTPSIVLVALASCLVALPARAEGPVPEGEPAPKPAAAPKPDPAKVAARLAELVKKGSDLCAAGEVDEGLAALNAAWTQKQDADLAVALASCEIKAEAWPAAAEHLAFALRNKDDPEQRKPLEATFTNVRARVGAVKVTVTVDGADVFVGDRFVGQSPLPAEVYVAPGSARISAKKTGYGELEKAVAVQARGTAALTLDLANESAVASARRSGERRSRTPAYVLGGLGVVVGGVGAALYAASASKGSAADALLAELQTGYPQQGKSPCTPSNPGCATLKSLRGSHDTFANVGTGFLAAGGALVAAAIGYGLWATFSTPPDRTAVTLAPVASPSGGGLLVRAQF